MSDEILPVNFGLKYNPPKLGIQYRVASASSQKATFVHEVSL